MTRQVFDVVQFLARMAVLGADPVIECCDWCLDLQGKDFDEIEAMHSFGTSPRWHVPESMYRYVTREEYDLLVAKMFFAR